ncbi:hypothetical protein ABIF65_004121 [Bradyrhizobium japonicum]|nr:MULTISPECIES: hypothetical protein [Bradyrhizobium]WLB93711.1 hypothetical protein QIH92_28380 [Bradyrhizobium japonicum USDA 123]MBR0882487.1 hypothetical protein [Bradyrhizobium liaoningense]MBR1002306.1 hypothetical protein [Bradyrhizobium liaoningense]MBR1068583.1 hypothetical protein [Bradyrhizobium liaoningense]MCP1740890.1 hypothetical protein [Bradyrhizobium japonicum]
MRDIAKQVVETMRATPFLLAIDYQSGGVGRLRIHAARGWQGGCPA